MTQLYSVVYSPDSEGLPFLAVLFTSNGEVLIARPVATREAGEMLMNFVISRLATNTSVEPFADIVLTYN